jgi:hypothetical protein
MHSKSGLRGNNMFTAKLIDLVNCANDVVVSGYEVLNTSFMFYDSCDVIVLENTSQENFYVLDEEVTVNDLGECVAKTIQVDDGVEYPEHYPKTITLKFLMNVPMTEKM